MIVPARAPNRPPPPRSRQTPTPADRPRRQRPPAVAPLARGQERADTRNVFLIANTFHLSRVSPLVIWLRTRLLPPVLTCPLVRHPALSSQKKTMVPAFLVDVVDPQFSPIELRLQLSQ